MHMIWYKGWKWDMPRGSLQTRQNVQLKRQSVALNQTSVPLPSLGPKRKRPRLQCQGAPCLNLCQLICHRGLTDHRASQPLQTNGTVICLFISKVTAKTWWHTEHQREERRRRRRKRKSGEWNQTPRLDSLVAVNTLKSPKVYCLIHLWAIHREVYSLRKPQKAP